MITGVLCRPPEEDLVEKIRKAMRQARIDNKPAKRLATVPHSNVFFTGDTHFGHRMLIEQGHRPFDDIDEMDHELITRWNAKVPKRGIVYHLGDVTFSSHDRTMEILRQLNGHIHLIIGNHDEKRITKAPFTDMFRWQKHYCRTKVPDTTAPNGKSRSIVLCHYPMMTWHGSYRGTWHLHGHCHGNLRDDKTQFRLDVGVDCHNYAPIDFETVVQLMSDRKFKPVDHHGDYS